MDENTGVPKQLAVGIGVLLLVSLLIGGTVGYLAVKAADVAGIDESGGTETDTGPPPGLGTSDPAETTQPPDKTTPTPEPTETTKTPEPPAKPIQLTASPKSAGTYERVNLTGTYQGGEGMSLQVQRNEGGTWVDFPTSATVSGGTFSTYIETGQTGPNQFRMMDPNGRTSNVVVVQIT
jgi:hypothetical protein